MSGKQQIASSGVKFAQLWCCCAASDDMICLDFAVGHPLSVHLSLSLGQVECAWVVGGAALC